MEDIKDRELSAKRARRLWVWLLSIPGLLVLLLACSWFFLQTPSVHTARCYFDAPPGEVLAFRSLFLRWVDGRQQPLAGPVRLHVTQQDGHSTEHFGASDSNGVLEFNVRLPQPANGALDLRLYEGGERERLLVGGQLNAPAALPATRRGGWIEGRVEGPSSVRVGLLSGVLAVPFESTLRIVVERESAPVPQQRLDVDLYGARLLDPDTRLQTDAAGRVDVPIVTEAHHVELSVRVEGTPATSYRGVLPVIPGAIHARAEGSTVVVESPVPRAVAFVNIIDPERTYLVKTVALQPQAGRFIGRFDVTFPLSDKWAVTSSEFDMQSMAAVGWPLSDRSVSSTLERKMWLGLDGLKQGRQRADRLRGVWRSLGVLVAVLALALELGLLFAYFRSWAWAAPRDVGTVFRPLSRSTFWLAASCVISGFAALTWWWWSRF